MENLYNWNNEKIRFNIQKYQVNNSTAIIIESLFDEKSNYFEEYGVLTVCIPEIKLKENEICVKLWSENESYKSFLKDFPELFQDTAKRVKTGFTEAHIWIFNENNLKVK